MLHQMASLGSKLSLTVFSLCMSSSTSMAKKATEFGMDGLSHFVWVKIYANIANRPLSDIHIFIASFSYACSPQISLNVSIYK